MKTTTSPLSLTHAEPTGLDPALVELVRKGLTRAQKELPAALLYDALGSTLFDAITLLPEYALTRADLRLLDTRGADVARHMGGPVDVVELGPGNGQKAALFLPAVLARQGRVRFHAVDVSRQALTTCERALEPLEAVRVTAHEARYLEGLAAAPREAGSRRLVLFLGSNLSNFSRAESQDFLVQLRRHLKAGDGVLLATDLEKSPSLLLPAYDDALGVTAAFNRNVLVRLNRELGARFELASFVHRARWNEAERRIEMHLEALRPCRVPVRALELELHFEASETIWTESSHRFSKDELVRWGQAARLATAAQWEDPQWSFAHTLYIAE